MNFPLSEDILSSVSKRRAKIFLYANIRKYPLICFGKDTKTYQFYTRLFLKYDLTLDPDIEATTADQILPEIIAKEAIWNKEVFRLKLAEELPERSICQIKDRDRPRDSASRELEKMLLAEKRDQAVAE